MTKPSQQSGPVTIFIDIETFPLEGSAWEPYDARIFDITHETSICCVTVKWLGGKCITKALPDFKGYKPGRHEGEDEQIVRWIWDILDECDIAVAQNGDEFDFKVINARFIHYGLMPPTPYKTVDTMKVWNKTCRTGSKRLGHIAKYTRAGEKLDAGGDPLWMGCKRGDKRAWAKMRKYNRQDTIVLEPIYKTLLPWIKDHPNMALWSKSKTVCPKCGSTKLQSRGTALTNSRRFQRFQCMSCGGWCRSAASFRHSGVEFVHAA